MVFAGLLRARHSGPLRRSAPSPRRAPDRPLAQRLAGVILKHRDQGRPYTGHLARILGFQPLPGTFFFALAGIAAAYLVLAETGKYWFYRLYHAPAAPDFAQYALDEAEAAALEAADARKIADALHPSTPSSEE
jgi:hypothetical protein